MNTPYRMEITIEEWPSLQRNFLNWKSRKGYYDKWYRKMSNAFRFIGPNQPLTKARITLTRYSSMVPDNDNLMASWKPVIDGLKKCKVIADDKPHVIGTPVSRHVKTPRGVKKITVLVEDVEKQLSEANGGQK